VIAGDRFSQIRSLLKVQNIDALLLNHEANVSYAVGFSAPDAYAFVTQEGIHLITDFRYAADYRRQSPAIVTVLQPKKSFFHAIAQLAAKSRIRSIGFESRHLTFAECEVLHDLLGKKTSFIPIKKSIESLRDTDCHHVGIL
jgi:Xaa-Pro aminopeptidase